MPQVLQRRTVALLVLFVAFSGLLAQTPGGKKVALLVGVNTYSSANFDPLSFAEDDVEALARILASPAAGFTQVRVLTGKRGKLNPDDAPTAANINRALEELLTDRRRQDTVLVALAGHGVQVEVEDPDDKQPLKTYSYFCPSDASLLGISYSTGKSKRLIHLTEFFRQLEKSDAGTRLVLMDACRNELKAETATRSVDVRRITIPEGVAALFSCKSGERSFEAKKLGHGVFFHFVLEGLRGKASNSRGEVTWSRLREYVTEQVTARVSDHIGGGAKQTPTGADHLPGVSPVLVRGGVTPPSLITRLPMPPRTDVPSPPIPPLPLSPKIVPFKADDRIKRYALIVGVSEFEDKKFPTLAYTENDAEALGTVFREAGYNEVVVLTNTRGKKDAALVPTARNIHKAMIPILTALDRDDLFVVCLCGTGLQQKVTDPAGKGPAKTYTYFVPTDGNLLNLAYPSGLSSRLIQIENLLETLARDGRGDQILFLDACRAKPLSGGTDVAPAVDLRVPEGLGLVCGCMAGERCYESAKLRHGIFSFYLLEGLRGAARDTEGKVTLDLLSAQVRREVSRNTPTLVGDGVKQVPQAILNLTRSPVLVRYR